jgi:hypothetical protein
MNQTETAPFFVDNEVIVLTRNGIWLADGTEISHIPTRKLFARSLKKDENGYALHIGRETKRIQVEDTAYFVQRWDGNLDSDTPLSLTLNDETQENLDPKSLNYRPGRLTCKIKSATEEAKFLHSAYFDLLRFLQEDQKGYYLEFNQKGKKTRIQLASRP